MHWTTSRVVDWKEREAHVIEIPMEGVPAGPPAGQHCEKNFALVFAGHGRTNSGGSWTVTLPGSFVRATRAKR